MSSRALLLVNRHARQGQKGLSEAIQYLQTLDISFAIFIGSILFWRIALRLEVWGYTNKTRLRGFQRVRAGGLRLCSRDFQSPGVSSKSGCSLFISYATGINWPFWWCLSTVVRANGFREAIALAAEKNR
ncbi:hypothetical protein [Nostoc sp.]|uniref:hypothetical protein n=1 Tax=Nostoc sp. TaxID=1180 RepID=UPI003FA560AF